MEGAGTGTDQRQRRVSSQQPVPASGTGRMRLGNGSDPGGSRSAMMHGGPISTQGVQVTAENSIFGLLHSWFLPAPPSNTGHVHVHRRGGHATGEGGPPPEWISAVPPHINLQLNITNPPSVASSWLDAGEDPDTPRRHVVAMSHASTSTPQALLPPLPDEHASSQGGNEHGPQAEPDAAHAAAPAPEQVGGAHRRSASTCRHSETSSH
eukprot:CAMPEP_0202884324 /NCGR_PEP_ID=MMETSP1391-20130828/40774_1 /ASSEMBLY_ACC=CAM_ASM_000867 /TAXON_ID=1034604 /ORGANISM="Chlamydomonas leiostraca, Strain SAG 11-49" /LENGTH=208 /DNA_ID=CAMNT_0049567491 /DNA_START=188 /DNA_END=811 /DNA_ORIENTATION=-